MCDLRVEPLLEMMTFYLHTRRLGKPTNPTKKEIRGGKFPIEINRDNNLKLQF